jgi:acyl carrier protein
MSSDDRQDVLGELTKVCRLVFDDEAIELNERTVADDVEGWDSLSHVQLMMAVERHFTIRLTSSEIGAFKDVGDLVSLIQKKKK